MFLCLCIQLLELVRISKPCVSVRLTLVKIEEEFLLYKFPLSFGLELGLARTPSKWPNRIHIFGLASSDLGQISIMHASPRCIRCTSSKLDVRHGLGVGLGLFGQKELLLGKIIMQVIFLTIKKSSLNGKGFLTIKNVYLISARI